MSKLFNALNDLLDSLKYFPCVVYEAEFKIIPLNLINSLNQGFDRGNSRFLIVGPPWKKEEIRLGSTKFVFLGEF